MLGSRLTYNSFSIGSLLFWPRNHVKYNSAYRPHFYTYNSGIRCEQQKRGEFESGEFWATHSSLLKQAWKEWETEQDLPALRMQELIDESLYDAVKAAWQDSSNEDAVKRLWTKVAPGVYQCRLLDPAQIFRLRQYLDEASQSKIPTRRPNGMNRHGIILTQNADGCTSLERWNVWYQELTETYLKPIGRSFFSEYYVSGNADDAESYAFTIRYKQGEDIALKEHSDSSLYTFNINLNFPDETYEGSSLHFVHNETGKQYNVTQSPGIAVLHRGMTRHAALPIERGHRLNLVIWFFGENDYVRTAPYEPDERLSPRERWPNGKTRNADALDSWLADL